jgi:hypothetical protein
VTDEQHEDLDLGQGQMRIEERIGPVVRKEPLKPLLRHHNVGDELFVVGHCSLPCFGPMAVKRLQLAAQKLPKGDLPDRRYQGTPAENHLFASGKLSVLAELISGEHPCHS